MVRVIAGKRGPALADRAQHAFDAIADEIHVMDLDDVEGESAVGTFCDAVIIGKRGGEGETRESGPAQRRRAAWAMGTQANGAQRVGE